ncbi:MAG: hypothetical protein AAFP97_07750 [Pseudomonadota bacterium]
MPFRHNLVVTIVAIASLLSSVCLAYGQDTATSDVDQSNILDRIRLSANLRLRYQGVERDQLLDGSALTARLHAAAEVDLGAGFRALAEVEAIEAFGDNYNDGTNFGSGLPLIIDPEGVELNRLQLVSETLPRSRMTLGRQRIALDDWRFLGAWPFRQNDQSLDAVRLETRLVPLGLLDVAAFNRVNRIQGEDNPIGVFRGTSWYANYAVGTPVGRFSAFHYDFSLRTILEDASTRTTGVRLFGRRHTEDWGFVWEGSYARQKDARDNPNDFGADYWLARLSVEPGDWSLTAKGEWLGRDGGQAVQTPLGALHGFGGLADQFLRTPSEGLRDLSIEAKYNLGPSGIFDDVSALVRIHEFKSFDRSFDYGDEIDLALEARIGDIVLSMEHARYRSQQFSTDTNSTVLSLSYVWGG